MKPRWSACAVCTAVALSMGATTAACSSDNKSTGSTTTSAGRNAESFSVRLPGGEAAVSLTGSLPPGWPEDFPVAPDARPAGSGSLSGSSHAAMVAVYTTRQSAPDVYDFYAHNDKLDVSEPRSIGAGSTFVGTMKLSGSFTGSVGVFGRETTYVVVALDASSTTTTVQG